MDPSADTVSTLNRTSKPRLHYILFLYREELRRRRTDVLRLSKVKIYLTNELIWLMNVRGFSSYRPEEVRTLKRELKYKRRLRKKLQDLIELQKLGLKNIDPKHITS